jgi:hypothetical protein
MRTLAIAAALCVSAYAATTTPVPPTAPAPAPKPSGPVYNSSNPVLLTFPANGVAWSLVAEWSSPANIAGQWNASTLVVKQAWDNTTNSYSESWGPLVGDYMQTTAWVNGTQTSYDPTGCWAQNTTDNITTLVFNGGWTASPAYPSKYVTQVADPFLGTNVTFNLFSSPDNENWMWINNKTGDLVYIQYWRPDWEVELVHYYPKGWNSTRATAYDFQVFQCQQVGPLDAPPAGN